MRYFVRSYYSKRRAQATVIKDTDLRQFEVSLWLASNGGPIMIGIFEYPLDQPRTHDKAKADAMLCATAAVREQDGYVNGDRT